MKPIFNNTLVTATLLAAFATPALAANSSVENAIKSRSDLSSFYEALVNSGVANELEPGRHYTIFAPTNEAFAKITPADYPCFYSTACRAEVASVVRNHIVPGEAYVADIARLKGGVYSLDKRFVNIADENGISKSNAISGKNAFTADGHRITYTSWFGGGLLYKIDGVIANERELSQFQYGPAVAVVADQRTVTTGRMVPGDTVTQTTVTTVPATAVVYPAYAPAR